MTDFPKDFTRQEAWLLQTAIVMGYALDPVETFYKHDDWYLDSEIWDCFDKDERIILSCEELRDLCSKPALVQRSQYGARDTVTRLTKAGWQRAKELAWRVITEADTYIGIDSNDGAFWLALDNL